MSPLASLALDLITDGRPSLAWSVEHAPDGDLDAALRRLWESSEDDVAMRKLGQLLDPATFDWTKTEAEKRYLDYDPGRYPPRLFCQWNCYVVYRGCVACADAIRTNASCPSLAAWVRARERRTTDGVDA